MGPSPRLLLPPLYPASSSFLHFLSFFLRDWCYHPFPRATILSSLLRVKYERARSEGYNTHKSPSPASETLRNGLLYGRREFNGTRVMRLDCGTSPSRPCRYSSYGSTPRRGNMSLPSKCGRRKNDNRRELEREEEETSKTTRSLEAQKNGEGEWVRIVC